jgi:glutamine amidotransferase-like uncharacterized protein
MHNKTLIILMLTAAVLSCANSGIDITVAIYSDNGTWQESVTACQKMFEWMGYHTTLIRAADINNNKLDSFNIICVPGGDMYQYAQGISEQGKENIRNFISNGKGYIGICGGASFAGERCIWRGNQLTMTPLRIFQGWSDQPYNEICPYPDYAMCKVYKTDSNHTIIQSEPDTSWHLYYWGPSLNPDSNIDVTVLLKYDVINLPAAICLEYGAGRVFVIGTHPEIEEDSNRDSVSFGDELDDHGSDWDLMKNASRWVLKEY